MNFSQRQRVGLRATSACFWPISAIELSIAGGDGRKIADCHEGPDPKRTLAAAADRAIVSYISAL
jgi:hypothetical protein